MHTFYKGFVFLFLFKIDCSAVSDSFAIPWTVACQAPLSMGFPQAKILEWVAISFSRGLSDPGIKSCIGRWIL